MNGYHPLRSSRLLVCRYRRRPASLFAVLGIALMPQHAIAQDHVADTLHNLAASGRGPIRAQGEPEICVFCHSPHTTVGATPMWNREASAGNYRIYESSTLDAKTGQPTGTSKLCLSCHDGTIALGRLINRRGGVRMSGGEFLPPGRTNLGLDLSDDHPISFKYSPGLAAADRQLNSPQSLPQEIKLDQDGQVQCTSCHDPHHNKYGNFLVAEDAYGALCTSCHVMDGWSASTHKTTNADVAGSSQVDWPHQSMAANSCRSCHRSHTARGRARLLINEAEEENCLVCHDGTVARTNVRAELDKLSGHDPRRYQAEHDPRETTVTGHAHVECSDCHNPHAVQGNTPQMGHVPIGKTLAKVPGVAMGGNHVTTARNEYEICLRCHGDAAVTTSQRVSRQAQHSNMRMKFSPTNASAHPVTTPSANLDTVSLAPGLARGSMIRCTDCHNSDSGPRAGGAGPDGPHGSIYESLLERNYRVKDDAIESEAAYAICYKCHRRGSILSNESFPEHRMHIVEERTPCSACHDPHGVSSAQATGSDHTHLINFDTRIVRPGGPTQRIEFRDMGRFRGSCTLTCHGADHDDEAYGMPESALSVPESGKRNIRRRP